METTQIIVYRNPLEQMFWSFFMSNAWLIFLFVINAAVVYSAMIVMDIIIRRDKQKTFYKRVEAKTEAEDKKILPSWLERNQGKAKLLAAVGVELIIVVLASQVL